MRKKTRCSFYRSGLLPNLVLQSVTFRSGRDCVVWRVMGGSGRNAALFISPSAWISSPLFSVCMLSFVSQVLLWARAGILKQKNSNKGLTSPLSWFVLWPQRSGSFSILTSESVVFRLVFLSRFLGTVPVHTTSLRNKDHQVYLGKDSSGKLPKLYDHILQRAIVFVILDHCLSKLCLLV